ncbi:MAG: hypothetical protein ABIG89_01990 [Candidatus Woesearchaeota archaeon]
MTEKKPKQIQAIELVKSLFESIHGNLGLLKFSLEKLEPNNGNGKDSDKWIVVCSFYKTFSSQEPTVYEANVNLKENLVSIIAIKGDTNGEKTRKFKIIEKKDNEE